jgi:hypothetical protein
MELEESPIYWEIKTIIEDGPKPISKFYTAKVHYDQESVDILKVLTVDFVKNFEVNTGDQIQLEVMIPLGTYVKKIFPNKHKLEISLTVSPLNEAGDSTSKEDLQEVRYKAMPVLQGMISYEGSQYDIYSEEALNNIEILNVSFQLIDRSLEKLRLVTFGGIFRDCLNEDVLSVVLASETNEVLVEGKPSIDTIDIVPTVNQEKRAHTLIPQGTKLIDVPNFIQKHCGGLNNTGVGSYISQKKWWVYPLFDTARFDEEYRKTLMVYKIPERKYSNIERTYRTDGNTTFILATGEINIKDDAEAEFLNSGNGFRQANADLFMGNGVTTTKDNVTNIKRSQVNDELVIINREDGVNNALLSPTPISSNRFASMSLVTARNGGIINMVWENSNDSLLIPGMLAKIHYMDGNDLVVVNGVLLYCHTLVQLGSSGVTTNRHTTYSALGFFVTKIKK